MCSRELTKRGAGGEAGYTMLALLALMTIMMIALVAAAPVLKFEAQRQRELETIRRGEQIADAIRMYIFYADKYPNSFDELIEGAPYGTKKVQVLRQSSYKDLLTEKGEWQIVRVSDISFLTRFCRDVTRYTGAPQPPTSRVGEMPRLETLRLRMCPQISSTLPTDFGGEPSEPEGSTGEFVGVVSKSRDKSIISYYGINRHNRWVFTPIFR